MSDETFLVQIVNQSFGTNALSLVVDDIDITRENQSTLLGKVLSLPGCGHHTPIWISDPDIAGGGHHTGLVVALLHVRFDRYQTVTSSC
ncbi:MAG: hypothetical protein ACK6BG_14420 [Cyanobacteriota bacterium]